MPGNRYAYAAAQMVEQEFLHPYCHVFFNHVSVHNEPDLTAIIMNQISLKEGPNKRGKKGRGSVQSDMKQLHMRDMFILLHMKDLIKEQRNTIL